MSTSLDDLLAVVIDRLADTVAQRLADRLPVTQATEAGLLDGPAMARQLGISQPTLDRLRKSGAVPVIRIGRRVMYSPRDVLAALSQQSAGN